MYIVNISKSNYVLNILKSTLGWFPIPFAPLRSLLDCLAVAPEVGRSPGHQSAIHQHGGIGTFRGRHVPHVWEVGWMEAIGSHWKPFKNPPERSRKYWIQRKLNGNVKEILIECHVEGWKCAFFVFLGDITSKIAILQPLKRCLVWHFLICVPFCAPFCSYTWESRGNLLPWQPFPKRWRLSKSATPNFGCELTVRS